MSSLPALILAIAGGDEVSPTPELARQAAVEERFLDAILHQQYAGDTALHIAAAAYRVEVARALVKKGADVRAKNRRGAEPLHYAVDGGPGAATWNPRAQKATVEYLLEAGADVNALTKDEITPLHRAVRNRCSAVVAVLLKHGADPRRKSKSGSTPLDLTKHNTGRGGSGSPAAQKELQEIVRLLSLSRRETRPGARSRRR